MKERLDVLVVGRGFAPSREKAKAIIDEMLLYSNDGVIEALPALPDEWKEGKIEGLRARTTAEVDIEWNEESPCCEELCEVFLGNLAHLAHKLK